MHKPTPRGLAITFSDPEVLAEGFSKRDIFDLACSAGDIVLAIDQNRIIRDIAASSMDYVFANRWIGRRWTDTVTVESRDKIDAMLDGRDEGGNGWRQLNHLGDGEEVPVSYRVIESPATGWFIAIGRDLRSVAALQQRVLKAQQAMERDYLNLRQAETRYRLLFDTIANPVVIADGETHQIQQANQAFYLAVGAAPGSLEGKTLLARIDPEDRDAVVAYLGAALVNPGIAAVSARFAGQQDARQLSATAFRQGGRQYWLVSVIEGAQHVSANQADRDMLEMVERMPDAFVLSDHKHRIIVANRAFADLVQAGSVEQLRGMSLAGMIGRRDIDLALLRKQLASDHVVRNFGSIVHDLNGGEEAVEISAVMIERDQPIYGYSVRNVSRRERDLPPDAQDAPRSVEQLTSLVGRKTLKAIVRESTDLIERMCIEAALVHTADNRASAAEILGLSRQSLYAKLHRHGLGNLTDRE
ncbi:transcriptional regulator PpsR [Sphingomonas sp. FW199]|uniref:transcriptional regulator PpsR n=1 Tax=Sphingomonas sp. FW199 TaxID=3400217 RepID=UPI003CE6AF46